MQYCLLQTRQIIIMKINPDAVYLDMSEDDIMKTLLYFFSRNAQKKAAESKPSYEADPEVLEFPDLFYTGKDGNVLSLDVYKPAAVNEGSLPVLFVIHGGGLFVGDSKLVYGFCRNLAKKGFLVFSLNYRLLTDANACGEISDVCDGFYYAETIIEKYGGDRNRVNVFGESAGAYLALYATAAQESDILREKIGCRQSNLIIKKIAFSSGMFYTKRLDLIGLLYPLQIYGAKTLNPFFMKYMNPENPEIMNHLPPALLVSSDADFLRKYTLKYAEALKKAGNEHQLIYYTDNEELTHSFAVYRTDTAEAREVMDQLCSHFKGT